MTEDQLKAFPAFAGLPVYDESDVRADGLVLDGKQVRECCTLDEVMSHLRDAQLVPLGALRAAVPGGTVVVAYFGERK